MAGKATGWAKGWTDGPAKPGGGPVGAKAAAVAAADSLTRTTFTYTDPFPQIVHNRPTTPLEPHDGQVPSCGLVKSIVGAFEDAAAAPTLCRFFGCFLPCLSGVEGGVELTDKTDGDRFPGRRSGCWITVVVIGLGGVLD